jgi:hypothetical protein
MGRREGAGPQDELGREGEEIGPRVQSKAGGLLLSLGWKKKGAGRWREAGQRAEREGVRGLVFFLFFNLFQNLFKLQTLQTFSKLFKHLSNKF